MRAPRRGVEYCRHGETSRDISLPHRDRAATLFERRKAAQRANSLAPEQFIEFGAVDGKLRAIRFLVPEMQHASREAPVLALDAAADHANDEIGVLQPPADEKHFEGINAIEVATEERKVAAAHAFPFVRESLAQARKRQAHQRQKAIDVATCTLHRPSADAPTFWLEIALENIFGERL